MKIAIYLAGTIKKGHEKVNESYWTEADIAAIIQGLEGHDVSILNPAFRADDLSDQHSVFGRDMLQVFSSHVVFVDARDRRGLGVGAEMMWAKINKIPVVTWAPKESHYHKTEANILGTIVPHFIHPFVEGLSDKIVETVEEGVKWIREDLPYASNKIKGIEYIGAAIDHYKKKGLPKDEPMQQLLNSSLALEARMQRSVPKIVL